MKKYKLGYTTGVYDLFHIGHLNLLRRAKEQCEYLIVGVSTDELVQIYKNKTPVIPFEERKQIVEAIKYVDEVVAQKNLNKIEAYSNLESVRVNSGEKAIFVGSDWKGSPSWNKYEQEFKKVGAEVVYLDYTDGISSTMLKQVLNEKIGKKEN